MDGCGVWSQTFKAIPVMPGVFAIVSKAGAAGSGDEICPAATAWHEAQLCCAYLKPKPGSPSSAASTPAAAGASGGGATQAAIASAASIHGARRRLLCMARIMWRRWARRNLKDRTHRPKTIHRSADKAAASTELRRAGQREREAKPIMTASLGAQIKLAKASRLRPMRAASPRQPSGTIERLRA